MVFRWMVRSLWRADVRMAKPVVIGLRLPRAVVAAEGRAEIDVVEWISIVSRPGIVALEHAVQPPLHHSRRGVAIPLNTVPHTERHKCGVHIGGQHNVVPTPDVFWILRQDDEITSCPQGDELLPASVTTTVEEECDLVENRAGIKWV